MLKASLWCGKVQNSFNVDAFSSRVKISLYDLEILLAFMKLFRLMNLIAGYSVGSLAIEFRFTVSLITLFRYVSKKNLRQLPLEH